MLGRVGVVGVSRARWWVCGVKGFEEGFVVEDDVFDAIFGGNSCVEVFKNVVVVGVCSYKCSV